MLRKLVSLVRQEEAFNRSRKPAEPQTESKKRPIKEVAYDSGDEAEVTDFIDRLLADDDIIVPSEGQNANIMSPKNVEKDDRAKRPPNWRLIAQHFESYGTASTTAHFPEVAIDRLGNRCKSGTVEMRLRRWKEDLNLEQTTNQAIVVNVGGRKVPYGDDLDNRLANMVRERIVNNLSVDSDTVRNMLTEELVKEGKDGLLKSNGGDYIFTKSWASRFFARHNFPMKLMNVRAKPLPNDFDSKLSEYENSLSLAIDTYKVPNYLVVSMSEIVSNFVPSGAKTRAKKNPKKIRLLGVTKNKTQITTTLCISESGEVLPPQVIFCGSTDRCHPTTPAPCDGYYTHSTNQQQTSDTMIEYIDKTLLPYRQYMLSKNKLSMRQYMVLKLTVHRSHLDPAVLAHMRSHFIIPVFVPDQCEEVLSEVEIACAKIFKSEVKTAFHEYVHNEYHNHIQAGGAPTDFTLDVKMSTIKGCITAFVARGHDKLTTASMKGEIKKVFAQNGKLTVCRTTERAVVARVARSAAMNNGGGGAGVSSSSGGGAGGVTVSGDDYDMIVMLPFLPANEQMTASAKIFISEMNSDSDDDDEDE